MVVVGAGSEDSCLRGEFCSWVSHCAYTSCSWTVHLTVAEMGDLRRCVFCHNEKLRVVGSGRTGLESQQFRRLGQEDCKVNIFLGNFKKFCVEIKRL